MNSRCRGQNVQAARDGEAWHGTVCQIMETRYVPVAGIFFISVDPRD